MKIVRTLAVVLAFAPLCARASTADDVTRLPGDPGKITIEGHRAPEPAPPRKAPVPLAVSATASLIFVAGGLALTAPEISFAHVLGFQRNDRRWQGWAGLGALSLAPAVALSLSGAHASTVFTGSAIEAASIGVTFGFAYLTDQAFHGNDYLHATGYLPLGVTCVAGVFAIVYPVFMAFAKGTEMEEDDDRPYHGVGLVPTRGGAEVTFAMRFGG